MAALTKLARRLAQRWPGVLAAAGSTVLACAPASTPAHSALAFTGVTVVDVTDGTLRPDQTVVIAGTRIRAVGPGDRVSVPSGARVVDARGKYLIPGLWDMHAHVSRPRRYFPAIQYPSYILNGVTGIRNLNVPCIDEARRWRRAIAAGERVGPRQFISGPALDGGTGNRQSNEPPAACGGTTHLAGPTAAGAQALVDSLKAAGADLLKLYEPPREVYFAIAAAARRAGLPFGGHLNGFGRELSIGEASDSGHRIVDHGHGLEGVCLPDPEAAERAADVAQCTALARRLVRNGTWVELEGGWASDLTSARWNDRMRYWPDSMYSPMDSATAHRRDSIAQHRRATQVLAVSRQAGLPIVVGTDAGPGFLGAPGFTLPDAIIGLAEWGLAPLGALRAATLNPAQALRATDSLGTVAPGKLADLVLLDGNPLADIHQIRAIRGVVADGRYFDRAALDRLLSPAAAAGRP